MRPSVLNPLFADVTSIKGVGPRLAALVAKAAGGPLVVDLVLTAPQGVIDRSLRPKVADAAIGSIATLDVTVRSHDPARLKRLPYRVICGDETGFLTLVFFNARPDYLLGALPVGARRLISGRIEEFNGARQMSHPDHIVDPDKADGLPLFEPVYPLTAGLTPGVMRKAVVGALARVPRFAEWQDAGFLAKNGWPGWNEAIATLHAPHSAADLSPSTKARQRLAYDELLSNQLALALVRRARKKSKGRAFRPGGELRGRALAALPFALTAAQRAALDEIDADMASPDRMIRLLQGDVGAGKTVVAFLAMTNAAAGGVQSALLAPTEILARQHFEKLAPLAAKLGLSIEILTGRDKSAVRAGKLSRLAAGDIAILIGTHAIFQEEIAFADLGFIVIDEQHRFGVHQRMALTQKGAAPDLLVMTATPIPRTLALTIYGDMDATSIREKPPGRKPIDTRAVPIERLDEVIAGVRRVVEKGEQAYWVCPLVEESDIAPLTSVEERYRTLIASFGDKVGLVHGKMPAAEKDEVMARFHRGAISILIATTVIEVGVDAPNATIIVIEHAERFGLAQLHQLRGRVGRGHRASACVLLYKGPLGETASERLKALRSSEDGFFLAEEDLRLRGAGDLLGAAQSGFPQLRFADLGSQSTLLKAARDDAALIVERDPTLSSPRGEALKVALYLFRRDDAARLLRAG